MERLAALTAVALARLLSWLPLSVARLLGGAYGSVVWKVNARPARITKVNLELCFPELSQPERERIGRQSLQETARVVAESGLIWYWPRERWLPLLVRVLGEDLIDEAMRAKKGLLLLVPHFGNWEYLNLYLGRHPFTALYDPPRIKSFEEPMRQARNRAGSRLLPIDRSGLRAIYRALHDGEVVAILPDQVPDRSAGVHAPFFGVPALTMTFAHRLIRKTHPVVLLASAIRVPRGFEIRFSDLTRGIQVEDATQSACTMNRAIEELVRTDPGQYQWEYKRFKKQPPGAAKVYPKESAAPVIRGQKDE